MRELRAEAGTRSAQWRALRDALLELGFRRDYGELELAALLARAGVTAADFEREFADLEDCYCEVYAVERDRILGELEAAAALYSTWRDRVRAHAYALWRAVSEDPRLTYFIFVGGRGAGERARREVDVVMEMMFDFLDEGRLEPGSQATSRATAESLGGAIWNQIAAAVNSGEQMEERVVKYLMYAVVLPYLGTEAAEAELDTLPPPLPEPLPR